MSRLSTIDPSRATGQTRELTNSFTKVTDTDIGFPRVELHRHTAAYRSWGR